MRCPHCKNHVLQKSGSKTRLRVKGAVEFHKDGICKALCYWCGEPVEVPIEIRKGTPISTEKFVLAHKG